MVPSSTLASYRVVQSPESWVPAASQVIYGQVETRLTASAYWYVTWHFTFYAMELAIKSDSCTFHQTHSISLYAPTCSQHVLLLCRPICDEWVHIIKQIIFQIQMLCSRAEGVSRTGLATITWLWARTAYTPRCLVGQRCNVTMASATAGCEKYVTIIFIKKPASEFPVAHHAKWLLAFWYWELIVFKN